MSVDHTEIIGIKITKTKPVGNVLLYYLKFPCVLQRFHMALLRLSTCCSHLEISMTYTYSSAFKKH
jgi:hypothetical protein